MPVCQNAGLLFGDPRNKDCSILGSILGSPILEKKSTMLAQNGQLNAAIRENLKPQPRLAKLTHAGQLTPAKCHDDTSSGCYASSHHQKLSCYSSNA